MTFRFLFALSLFVLSALSAPCVSYADDAQAIISLVLQDHKFDRAEIMASAGKMIVLEISNHDTTAAEIESKELRIEKVIPAGGQAKIIVRKPESGRYRFFDDYHEQSAEIFLVVQ